MTLSKRLDDSLKTLLSQVFVPYYLRVCFVFPWYPGYEAEAKQTRRKHEGITELGGIFQASCKRFENVIQALFNEYFMVCY
jgi:galactose-1-phosphate uridylyltransferase